MAVEVQVGPDEREQPRDDRLESMGARHAGAHHLADPLSFGIHLRRIRGLDGAAMAFGEAVEVRRRLTVDGAGAQEEKATRATLARELQHASRALDRRVERRDRIPGDR